MDVSSATTLQAIHRRCRWVIAVPVTCRAFMGIISDYWQNTFTHAGSTRQRLDSPCAAAVSASTIRGGSRDYSSSPTNATRREVRHNAKRVLATASAKCTCGAYSFPFLFYGNTSHSTSFFSSPDGAYLNFANINHRVHRGRF